MGMRSFNALSVVAPAGDRIRSGVKRLEIRRWKPDTLPLRDLLIVQNRERLSGFGKQEDPDGHAVAMVDVTGVREWKREDLDASTAGSWEPGWLAWEIANVRPFDFRRALPARRRIYQLWLAEEG